MKTWFFVADAHLSEDDLPRQQKLVDFLEANRDRMSGLVILGDLFDFWFGFPDYIHPPYRPLCETLVSLTRSGVRLIYCEGNHDFSMGPFVTEALQGEVYPRYATLELDGQRVLLGHGDGVDPRDLRYRIYRALLKNRIMYRLIRFLGPQRTWKIKNFLSSRSWMHRRQPMDQRIPPDVRFARERCRDGADVVILAHTHRLAQESFLHNGRTCYYFNVGDWVEHCSYVSYSPQAGFQLGRYDPAGESSVPPETVLTDRSCAR
jgi:UDP-2,3-diacylglucosamine hydrolase